MMGARGPPGPPGPPVSSHRTGHCKFKPWGDLIKPHTHNLKMQQCYVDYMMTYRCASPHSTGSSGTHRTPWWAWRAWTDCKIILQNIHCSSNYHMMTELLCCHSLVRLILKAFVILVFFPQGPVGARGPPGPPGKAGEDVRIHLCFYESFCKKYTFFLSCVVIDLWSCGVPCS